MHSSLKCLSLKKFALISIFFLNIFYHYVKKQQEYEELKDQYLKWTEEECDSLIKTSKLDPKNRLFHKSFFEFTQEDGRIHNESFATIISVYFELDNSKHSTEKYDKWIEQMSTSITAAPLVLLCNCRAFFKIRKLRNKQLHVRTKYYLIDRIWDVMSQLELERNQSYTENYLLKQNKLDPEYYRHNPDLYAIWNLKSYIVRKIAQENPFNSKFFIYSDAGAWRIKKIPAWPDQKFIQESLLPLINDRILFAQMSEFKNDNFQADLIQAGFFAGTRQSLENFYENFFDLHDRLLAEGRFIGKEQNIMNLIVFKYFPKSNARLKPGKFWCLFDYNKWFYYQIYLSNSTDDLCHKKNKLNYLEIF